MAETLAKELLETFSQAETEMLRVVARRLSQGIDDPGWAETKLAQTQVARRQLEKILNQVGQVTPRQLEEAITKAYGIGQAAAGLDLETTGRVTTAFTGSGDATAIRVLAREAFGVLSQVGPHALRAAEDIYRDVIYQAARQVSVGTQTRRQAAQRALNAFADRGITGFVDSAGRNWDMASYTEMSVRTTTGRAAVAGHADKLADEGLDLVQVSDAPEECSICRPWEGRVLSLRGRTPGRPTLSDATSAGLFHPNCRHSVGLYDRRISTIPKRTADPQGDQLRQQQRYLERQVRSWKRREVSALSPAEAAKAKAKVGEWQSSLRSFVADNDRKRLRYREQIKSAR
jgi:hypothetical protein